MRGLSGRSHLALYKRLSFDPSAWPEDIASWVREGDAFLDNVLEQWTLPTRLGLEQVGGLAQAHREYFAAQIDVIVERLLAGQGHRGAATSTSG